MDLVSLTYGSLGILAGIVFIVTAIFVYRKDPSYDLNRLIALSIASLSLLVINSGVMYILQTTDPLIMNTLRDLAEIGSLLSAFFVFLGGIQVNYGREWRGIKYTGPLLILAIVSMIFMSFEHVGTETINGTIFYYFASDVPGGFIFITIVPLVALVAAISFFERVRRISRDTLTRRSLGFMELGMGLIMVTAAFLVLILQILIPGEIIPFESAVFLVIIGQSGYLLASFLLYLAFRSTKEAET